MRYDDADAYSPDDPKHPGWADRIIDRADEERQ
jgi:hypothetical protein